MRKHPTKVYRKFRLIPRNKATYYSIRSRWFLQNDPITRAALFFYLNRNCFNGIYRTNTKGVFNVPFSNSRVASYPTQAAIEEAADLLRNTRLFSDDFEPICTTHVRTCDFIYLDPPYYIPAKRVFREYSRQPFCEVDLYRLKRVLRHIHKAGARFLLSYPNGAIASELARDWNRTSISVRRTISGNLQSRKRTRETLIYNYDVDHV